MWDTVKVVLRRKLLTQNTQLRKEVKKKKERKKKTLLRFCIKILPKKACKPKIRRVYMTKIKNQRIWKQENRKQTLALTTLPLTIYQ